MEPRIAPCSYLSNLPTASKNSITAPEPFSCILCANSTASNPNRCMASAAGFDIDAPLLKLRYKFFKAVAAISGCAPVASNTVAKAAVSSTATPAAFPKLPTRVTTSDISPAEAFILLLR